jgi:hypothetical protein
MNGIRRFKKLERCFKSNSKIHISFCVNKIETVTNRLV